MSTSQTALSGPALPALNVNERRVLGVLVEKGKTTPDAYPLSLNALTTGCNQKSNRDPLLDLNDLDVEEALAGCQKKGLVFKITGGRVERWKHNLYEAWNLGKVDIAIIGELLLRGPQTEGELRSRASRMEPIGDLETLRALCKSLAERGLIAYLTPEGRRGTTLTHGFHEQPELAKLKARAAAEPVETASKDHQPEATNLPVQASASSHTEKQIDSLRAEVAALREQMTALGQTLVQVQNQLAQLKASLGE
jgi:uncharacterized protein